MGCDHTTTDCNCCRDEVRDPVISNRPGLPALNYRIGTYGSFFTRMLGKLNEQVVTDDAARLTDTPLQELTTREKDDHTIALLDAWAVTSDVLTFYQERIANEGFLRTATERRSVLELASEIGYELSPGVAAEADLAFQVEEVTVQSEVNPITLPDRFKIPKGTQVMSMPQGDELPKTFETLEEFEARPGWNSLRPRLSWDQDTPIDTKRVWLNGTSLNVKAGTRILLIPHAAGSPVVCVVRTVKEPKGPDGEMVLTEIVFEEGIEPSVPSDRPLTPTDPLASLDLVNGISASSLETLFGMLVTEADLQALLKQKAWNAHEVLSYAGRKVVSSVGQFDVYAFREKTGVLGNNAVHYDLVPEDLKDNYIDWLGGEYWSIWSDPVPPWLIIAHLAGTGGVAPPIAIGADPDPDADAAHYSGADFFLDRIVDRAVTGGYVILERSDLRKPFRIASAIEQSRNAFAMATKATGLTLNGVVKTDDTMKAFTIRNTTVHSASERIALARRPDPFELASRIARIDLDCMTLGLSIGQTILIKGERFDAANVQAAESCTIQEIYHHRGRTILVLEKGLAYSYKRSTVRIMANVVRASHGEKVAQVLGSGDSSTPHQHFMLSKAELTQVQASNTSGRESTLTVRVDGVAWTPVPSLYDRSATDKVYITRIDDDAKATVQFGDGKMGARVPTGQVNITTEYRAGIGLDGEVAAGTLTLLKSKPYGVKSVINPIKADGAEDPETLDTARDNAPLTVRTLDRVVSLPDYEDFSAAFAGIGKATAVELWTGAEELVHITVLDPTGGEVMEDQLNKLRKAISGLRDPNRRFIVQSGETGTFHLAAEVIMDPAYVWEDVQAALTSVLLEAFSYDARSFGQPVSKAEVLERMHTVAGVVAVDVNVLDISGGTGLNEVLASTIARFHPAVGTTAAYATPAAVLLLQASGITLTKKTHAA